MATHLCTSLADEDLCLSAPSPTNDTHEHQIPFVPPLTTGLTVNHVPRHPTPEQSIAGQHPRAHDPPFNMRTNKHTSHTHDMVTCAHLLLTRISVRRLRRTITLLTNAGSLLLRCQEACADEPPPPGQSTPAKTISGQHLHAYDPTFNQHAHPHTHAAHTGYLLVHMSRRL